MPECQVHDCRNERGKPGKGKGLSFFQIPDGRKPENREIAQRWLHFCGTGHKVNTFKFGRDKLVCEKHFNPDCFTDDAHIRMCTVFGTTPRYSKVLKPGSVPTVVSHHRQTYDADRAERAQRRETAKVSNDLIHRFISSFRTNNFTQSYIYKHM